MDLSENKCDVYICEFCKFEMELYSLIEKYEKKIEYEKYSAYIRELENNYCEDYECNNFDTSCEDEESDGE